MNLSEYYFLNLTAPHDMVFTVREIVDNYCAQIDDRITLALFLILTFYVLSRIVIPLSEKVLIKEYPIYAELISRFYRIAESFSETLSLCAVIFILGLRYYQGDVSTGYYYWVGCLITLISGSYFIRYRSRGSKA